MRLLILTIILFSTSTISFCQKSGKLMTKVVREYKYNYVNIDFVLENIERERADIKNNNIYRIWTDSNLIEVTEINDSIYFGQIISFAFRIKKRDESITKIHYIIDELSNSDTKDILKRVIALDNVSTSDSIPGFILFLDGNFYGIDKLTNGQLLRRNYNDILGQKVTEFEPIKELFIGLENDFLKSRNEIFISKLPYGAYKYISGSLIMEKR